MRLAAQRADINAESLSRAACESVRFFLVGRAAFFVARALDGFDFFFGLVAGRFCLSFANFFVSRAILSSSRRIFLVSVFDFMPR